MKADSPLVSVVILNWNRIEDTLGCLDSIRKQTYKNIEIVVVDNGSVDDSKNVLSKINDIIYVDNPTNRGFTGGHIDGLSHTNGSYIFVLNNDAVVDSKYVEKAVQTMLGDEAIAVVGGRSYAWKTEDDIYQENIPYYAFQEINSQTAEGIFLTKDMGFAHKTTWVSGSAMLIRKSAIDKVGYFYDPMFAYYEETDLFARLLANNYSVVYNPELKIWHKDGGSSSSSYQLNQLFKNRFIFALRNYTLPELFPFIYNYKKFLLKGSVKHLLKHSSDPQEREFNEAIYNASKHAIFTWPKWLKSRTSIARTDNQNKTYIQKIVAQKQSISLVILWSDLKKIRGSESQLPALFFEHPYCELVIVSSSSDEQSVSDYIKVNKLQDYPVFNAVDKNQSEANTLNIGWLSTKYDYVGFLNDNIPSVSELKEALYNLRGRACIYHTGQEMVDVHGSLSIKLGGFALIHRNILASFGGITLGHLSTSVASLVAFATLSPEYSVTAISHRNNQSKLQTIELPDNTVQQIKRTISERKNESRKHSPYARLLQRNYRLYQLHNLSTWIVQPAIPLRTKAGRIKNLILSVLRFDKKSLALELKHMTNEVIKIKNIYFNKEDRDIELVTKANELMHGSRWKNTPVFIICRDRLTPLKQLVTWLEKLGMHNIIFIDNDSIYTDLVDFYSQSPYQVIRTRKNIGHTVVWNEGIAKTLFPGSYYIVSDPDVIPDDKCPDDAINYFYSIHKIYVDYQKVGFGLQIDDLPDHYKLKNTVITWESQFWEQPLDENIYEAGIDTTFALYKPYTDFYTLHPSIRTGRPYTAKHLPWYVNSNDIDPEEAFYRMHASQDITSWNTDEILDRYKKELNNT